MKRLGVGLIFILLLSSTAYSFDRKGFTPTAPYSVLSTFSAETPMQNQIAIGLDYDLTTDPDRSRLNLNISYGLTESAEILLNLPYNLYYRNSSKMNGAEDLNIGLKHRIIDETTFTPAIAYLLFASGDLGKDEFSTEGGVGAGFIVTKKIGPFKAHGNIIYFRPEKEVFRETWNINLGAELSVSYNSKLLFEIIGRKAIDRSKIDLVEWRIGYRIRITEFSYTTVGFGFDVKNRNPDMRFMFGISAILPPYKGIHKKIVDEVD